MGLAVRNRPSKERIGLDGAAFPLGGEPVAHGAACLGERAGEAIDANGDQVRDVGRALQLRAPDVLLDAEELGVVGPGIHWKPPSGLI